MLLEPTTAKTQMEDLLWIMHVATCSERGGWATVNNRCNRGLCMHGKLLIYGISVHHVRTVEGVIKYDFFKFL